MSHSCLLSLLQLILFVTPGVLECDLSGVRKCPSYSLISKPDLHAFIPKDRMTEICYRLMQALQCAYQPNVLGTCSLMATLPFDVQRGVIQTVCVDKRDEYATSAKCFNSDGFKERLLSKCMKLLVTRSATDRCLLYQYVSRCSADVVLATDGCLCSDADYMEDLVRIYILPTERIMSCDTHYTRNTDCPATNNTAVKEDPTAGKSKDVAGKDNRYTVKLQGIAGTEIENTAVETTSVLQKHESSTREHEKAKRDSKGSITGSENTSRENENGSKYFANSVGDNKSTLKETMNAIRNNTSAGVSYFGSSCHVTSTTWTTWFFRTMTIHIVTIMLTNGRFPGLVTDNWRL